MDSKRTLELRELMSTPVLALAADQPAGDAFALMRSERVRHAVAMRGKKIVGVVSDSDLGGPNGGRARAGHTVADLMQSAVVVGKPRMGIEQALALFTDREIGCLPIVDRGRLVGIVTRGDLLRCIANGGVPPERGPARRGASEEPRAPRVSSPNIDKHL